MKDSKSKRIKKTLNIVGSILFYTFLICCLVSVTLTMISKRSDDGAMSVFGYKMYIVSSNSMEKCELTDVSEYEIGSLPIRSAVFVKNVPDDKAKATEFYSSLKVGDVLTFRYVYTSQVTITHRIIKISPKAGEGYIIELAGDNKNAETNLMTQKIDTSDDNSTNYVIGKVIGVNYPVGLVLSMLKEPVGIICSVIVPSVLIILYEVKRIVGVFTAESKKKARDELTQKDAEIEELKRKLSEKDEQVSDDADRKEDVKSESHLNE